MDADMVYAPSSTDYRRAVRATFLWAAVTPWIATCVALSVCAGRACVPGIRARWEQMSIWGVVSSFLASALGVWGWYVALRCIVLSVASVVRSRGYPERHWWFVRRAFRRLVCDRVRPAGCCGGP